MNNNDNRRIRPAMADLTEYGKRYNGKKVTRKLVEAFNDEEEEESHSFKARSHFLRQAPEYRAVAGRRACRRGARCFVDLC